MEEWRNKEKKEQRNKRHDIENKIADINSILLVTYLI